MILFTDLDDTLLTTSKAITPDVSSAVSRALMRGHRIVICTGRPLGGVTPLLDALALNRRGCYAICYNGGLIWDCHKKKTVWKKTLSMEQIRHIFRLADQYQLYCQTYTDGCMTSRSRTEEADSYIRKIGVPYREDPGLPDSLSEGPVKALFISLRDPEKLERFRRVMEAEDHSGISVFYSNACYLEAVPEGVSKGSAIRRFCAMSGIPLADTVGAGDAENDIPMLQTVRISCAMANATAACKAAADYVTARDCDHGGVAEIINRFLT